VKIGAIACCIVVLGCAPSLPEAWRYDHDMVMLVEDNYSVRLDGTWLDGIAAIETALNHVHAVT
jgi:hypothetical protein